MSLSLNPNPITESATTTLQGTLTDTGPPATHSVTIDWGDGSALTTLPLPFNQLNFSAAHQYLENNPNGTPPGIYIIQVSAAGANGFTGSGTIDIAVNDAPLMGGSVSIHRPGTPNALFIDQVYRDLLRRPADPVGFSQSNSLLVRETPRAQVVLAIEASPEYRARVVEDFYHQFLHRNADPLGLQTLASLLEGSGTGGTSGNGGDEQHLKALLIGSDEYFQNRGNGTNAGWLAAVYKDLLHRGVDAGGNVFLQSLAQGNKRSDVAAAIIASLEAAHVLAQNFFERFLHRGFDANKPADQFFVTELVQGKPEGQVIAEILGSAEYFTLASKAPLLLGQVFIGRVAAFTDPATSSAQLFVNQIYQDLLNRPADSNELSALIGLLNMGKSRSDAALVLLNSDEFYARLIQGFYTLYLNRDASPSEVNNLLPFINSGAGGSIEDVQSLILGSQEYFNNLAVKNNSAFLDALYNAVLNRPVDPAGAALFLSFLNNGGTRGAVAAQVLSSTEHRANLYEGFYQSFLNRDATADEINAALADQERDEQIIAILIGAREYFRNVLDAHYSVSIDWGDSSVSNGMAGCADCPLNDSSDFDVFAKHAYNSPGLFTVKMTLNDVGGATVSASSQATVTGPPLKSAGRVVGGTRGVQGLPAVQRPELNWLDHVYHDLLDRPIDPTGAQNFISILGDNGIGGFEVASAIESTREFRSNTVQGMYQNYLRRSGDADGVDSLVNDHAAGFAAEQLKAVLLGSPEYFNNRGGGNNVDFLKALYKDVLGRQPAGSELIFPVNITFDDPFFLDDPALRDPFSPGMSPAPTNTSFPLRVSELFNDDARQRRIRTQLALNLLESDEALQGLITMFYHKLLNRDASTAEINALIGLLRQGETDEEILAGIASLPEYFTLSQSMHLQTNTTFLTELGAINDPNPDTISGNFTATIDWGDGSALDTGAIMSPGVISLAAIRATGGASGGGSYEIVGRHSYSTSGSYTIETTTTDTAGRSTTTESTAVVDHVNQLPVINSGPSASPNPTTVGQAAAFQVAATDPDGDTLSYDWDFNDGLTHGSGAAVTHTFTLNGSYTVKVTISDGQGGSVSGSVTVAVGGGVIGSGPDSDGDGFSDSVEAAAGTSPTDPLAVPADKFTLLTDVKLSIKLSFKPGITGKDKIALSGTIAVPPDVGIPNSTILVDVGGVLKSFKLDANSSQKTANESIKLSVRGTTPAAKTVKLAMKANNGDFASALQDEGLTGDTTISPPQPRNVVVNVIFNHTAYQTTKVLKYSAKSKSSGSGK